MIITLLHNLRKTTRFENILRNGHRRTKTDWKISLKICFIKPFCYSLIAMIIKSIKILFLFNNHFNSDQWIG